MHRKLEALSGFNRPLPRGPVLDWKSFGPIDAPNIHSVENLKHKVLTTSGRAAIYQALLQLNLPAYSSVLIPTYHCPTMVAPVLLANLNVSYFGLLPTGLPNLDAIEEATARKCKAMLVPHYFGLPQSLKDVRQWCDDRGILLIEDCAHCFFGMAGERNVGEWGDYATASLSKFFPLPEAGLLISAHHSLSPVILKNPTLGAQIKGFLDVAELASRYQKFSGISTFLTTLFKLKNISSQASVLPDYTSTPKVDVMMRDCDMARINKSPLWASIVLKNILPRGRIIHQRQINFSTYESYFSNTNGARPLFQKNIHPTEAIAPYVFPLWVDEPDAIYRALRAMKLPVFRWDRIWPNVSTLPEDVGPLWSHHVLQLLCHQDLSTADIEHVAQAVLQLLKAQQMKTHFVNP